MLSIQNVNYSYNKELVLEDISFDVKPGQFIGIIGPNGSGKTTLLRLIAGFFSPLNGSVTLQKKKLASYRVLERAKKIAVVPQYHLVNPMFTVEKLVEMGIHPYLGFFKRITSKDKTKIDYWLKQLDIFELKNRKLKNLSGGELQRALLAKALVQDTPIILMDEPTNHLDIHYQTKVLDLIKKFQKEKKRTIITVFHDLSFAAKYSDQILVLNKKIVAFGKPSEVLNKDLLAEVYHTSDFVFNRDLRLVLK